MDAASPLSGDEIEIVFTRHAARDRDDELVPEPGAALPGVAASLALAALRGRRRAGGRAR